MYIYLVRAVSQPILGYEMFGLKMYVNTYCLEFYSLQGNILQTFCVVK